MGLTAGDRLGPYEILTPIGEGGMGEVYRAHDVKLNREVAIKILPLALAQDPDRLARFEREAKVLATLNHPNIAAIYGLEDRAIVMELIQGLTLAERIAAGPIPLEEVLKIASQIVDALESAHEKGIVHRDLKPANVKVSPDGVVKVLDFGLATAAQAEARATTAENSPTLTMAATEVGIILGTAAYMSPEQAAGKPVDKRADIWSFGVVLWEMLKGSRLFAGGETVSHTLADVLRAEIDFGKLPSSIPPAIRQLLKRCLDRNVKTRLRDIGEARIILANPGSGTVVPQQATARATWLPWAVASAVALFAAALSFVHFREQPPSAEVTRFEIPQPEKTAFGIGPPVLSPDGRKLAFIAGTGSVPTQVWVRTLDSAEARPLTGTENAVGVIFWSPDSRAIAFWAAPAFKLKRAELSGGPVQILCDTQNSPPSGAWNRDGVIIFHSRGLSRVPAAGGDCTDVTRIDASRGEIFHRFPSFLPDGRHFLYFRQSTRPENNGTYVGSLDVKPEQQNLKRLMESDSNVVYVPSPHSRSGYLLFLGEGTLMARPFNPDRMDFAGDAVPVVEQVAKPISAVGGYFSVSATGALAFRTGVSNGADLWLTWFDRHGKPLGRAPTPAVTSGATGGVSFSPDGRKVAFVHADAPGGNPDIWLYEFARGTSTRFTFDPSSDVAPIWSPDGKLIVFGSDRDGMRNLNNLYRKTSNNAGTEELLLKSDEPKVPSDWSRDGRFLLFQNTGPGSGPDIWYLPMNGTNSDVRGSAKPEVYLKSRFAELHARFSPDGRYVAYDSDASGVPEVYVQPFPNPAGGKWMVSKAGGRLPRWRRDGKELFYDALSGTRLMVVDVSLQPVFRVGIPNALFDFPPGPNDYDVSADGQRFVKFAAGSTNPDTPPSPITIVLNWQAGLKK